MLTPRFAVSRKIASRSTISADCFMEARAGNRISKPYTFEDVAAALNEVAPYDWSAFLRTRLDSPSLRIRMDESAQ